MRRIDNLGKASREMDLDTWEIAAKTRPALPPAVVLLETGEGSQGNRPATSAGTDAGLRTFDETFGHDRLVSAFLEVAGGRAHHLAIVIRGEAYSYQWVANAASVVAGALVRGGLVDLGGCVVLMLDNSPEYLAGFYGSLLAGCTVVPVPPDLESARLAHIVDVCDVRAVLTHPRILARRLDLSGEAAQPLDLNGPIPARRAVSEPRPGREGSPAVILFTAGSCGEPKGVMLSDANLLANAASICRYLPIREDDRALGLLPFHHAYGNSVVQTHLLRGATLVVDGTPAFPNTLLEAMRLHRVTSFAGVPEVYYSLLSHSDLGETPLPDLRYATVAGGAIRPDAALAVAERIGPAEFYVMYGQTEATARLAWLAPEELKRRPGSIGKAIPGVELEVVDEEGRPARPGEPGELRARGPNVMLGYWRDPEATSRTLRDGWLYTGDLASRDEEGYLYVKSRASELVKIQGFRTHPREIEEAVSRHFPDARIVVVPFRLAGATRLALYFSPGKSRTASADEIRRVCLRELPRVKVPSYIECVTQLPLNAAGKVDRVTLARRAERHMPVDQGRRRIADSAA
jgi:long-chain acyl-CoA synthetase